MKFRVFITLLAILLVLPCVSQDMNVNVLNEKIIEVGSDKTYVRDSYSLFVVYAEKSDLRVIKMKLFNVSNLNAFDDSGNLDVLDSTITLRNPLGSGFLQAKFATEYYVGKPSKIDDRYKFFHQIRKPELITNKPEIVLKPNFYLKSTKIILPHSTVFYVYPSKEPEKIKDKVELNWGQNQIDKEIILEFGNIELAIQAETEIKLMEEELKDIQEKYQELDEYLDLKPVKKNLDLAESKLIEAIKAYDADDFSMTLEKTKGSKFFLESAKNLLDEIEKDHIDKVIENITNEFASVENTINSIEKTGADVTEAKIYLQAAKQKLEDVNIYRGANPHNALLLANEAHDNLKLVVTLAEKAEKKEVERIEEKNAEKRTRLVSNLLLLFILLLTYIGLRIWR